MTKGTAIAASLLVAACASGGGGSEGIVDFSAQLQPTAGNQVRGTANAVSAVGETAITIEIENATPGARHPWHVHTGTCGNAGPPVGGGSNYPVLEIEAGGEERAVATIPVQLEDDAQYIVNVHQSPQAMSTIISCGALVD
jgi:hypothetical protein